MNASRRNFLKAIGIAGTAGVGCPVRAVAENGSAIASTGDAMGVLVDLTLCVGCRKCEYACQEEAGFDVDPIESFEDKSVFERQRRPGPREYTVVNRYDGLTDDAPACVKVNCLHCLEPACVSACLVSALRKEPSGPVVYDASRCMGCRYCMVACPFQIPTYDYDNALTPQVRKCTMCFGRQTPAGQAVSHQPSAVSQERTTAGQAPSPVSHEGRTSPERQQGVMPDRSPAIPACVSICPQDCLTYGRRSELLKLAHDKIRERPEHYVDHVYGEHEAGGTSWLYLSNVRFEDLGFLKLGDLAPSELTEMIQHGVFKHWVPPFALYALLGVIMWLTRRESEQVNEGGRHGGTEARRHEGEKTVATGIPESWNEKASGVRI